MTAPAAADPTLLGLCDGELDPQRHRTSFLTNKVGGRPDWTPALTRPRPRCRRCGARSLLVVQVYCPLDTSPYHRNLHLFACPSAGCCGSGGADAWTVLRSQCLEAEATGAASPHGTPCPGQAAPLTATDWCAAADDWGDEEEGGWGDGDENSESQVEELTAVAEAKGELRVDREMDVGQQLQNLHLEEEEDVPQLRPFFISVVDEADLGGKEDEDSGLSHAHQLLQEYEKREGVAVGEMEGGATAAGGGEGEKYEKMKARHGDASFSRFMKKIAACPQQILRYCRGGEPLFISEPPAQLAAAVTPCSSCRGPRTLELQLMPALVSLLQRTDDGSGGCGGEQDVGLEFGTVLVYTCTKSCWAAGSTSAVEEVCLVQADPDQQLFR